VSGRRWRSALFIPATRPELAAKALKTGPDVVIVDLEDAVAPDAKAGARTPMQEAVAELAGHVAVCVRVNPPSTPWFEADVAALPDSLTAIVLPKFEGLEHLVALDGRAVIAGLETVRGVLDARELLPATAGCYFGAEDYVADLGGVRTAGNDELVYPRAHVAAAARLAGVPALDMVTIDVRDGERFVAEAQQARALGYAGKLCIHPSQVALARAAFRPSDDEVAWATGILAAFEAADGATIAVAGEMVDAVVAIRARAILAAAED
jgi:citrate lyase subunit beta/citryl-CoA lyase